MLAWRPGVGLYVGVVASEHFFLCVQSESFDDVTHSHPP